MEIEKVRDICGEVHVLNCAERGGTKIDHAYNIPRKSMTTVPNAKIIQRFELFIYVPQTVKKDRNTR